MNNQNTLKREAYYKKPRAIQKTDILGRQKGSKYNINMYTHRNKAACGHNTERLKIEINTGNGVQILRFI